jgi:serine/threonine protein phosphatase 1
VVSGWKDYLQHGTIRPDQIKKKKRTRLVSIQNALKRHISLMDIVRLLRPDLKPAYPEIADTERLYVIGDIHGCDGILAQLHKRIDDHRSANGLPEGSVQKEIYLGDYIDRGPDSAATLESLIKRSKTHDTIFLRGNHEWLMQRVLKGIDDGYHWLQLGGDITLKSYLKQSGITDDEKTNSPAVLLRESVPDHHVAFLERLNAYWQWKDYIFVHAGIRPGYPIEEQKEADLYWIRDSFLTSKNNHGHIIVHGHTPVEKPDFQPNRINIDTGIYKTGRLTCLVIDKNGANILP